MLLEGHILIEIDFLVLFLNIYGIKYLAFFTGELFFIDDDVLYKLFICFGSSKYKIAFVIWTVSLFFLYLFSVILALLLFNLDPDCFNSAYLFFDSLEIYITFYYSLKLFSVSKEWSLALIELNDIFYIETEKAKD